MKEFSVGLLILLVLLAAAFGGVCGAAIFSRWSDDTKVYVAPPRSPYVQYCPTCGQRVPHIDRRPGNLEHSPGNTGSIGAEK